MQSNPSDPSAAPRTSRRQPCWRLWRVLFLLLATPLTLLALFYAEEDWRARRDWNRFEAEQASRETKAGSEATGAAPANVPDDQNFFATPYWKLAPACLRTLMSRETPPTGADAGSTNMYAQALAKSRSLWILFDGGRNGDWRVGRPMELTRWSDVLTAMTARRLEPDARFFTDRELREYGPKKPVRSFNAPPSDSFSGTNDAAAGAVVLSATAVFEPVLGELTLASGRPYSRFDANLSSLTERERMARLVSDFLSVREAGWMTRLRCGVEVALGERDAAGRDLNLGLRIATANASSPEMLPSSFTGICLEWCLQSLWEGMIRHEWSEPQLQGFQDRLRQIDLLGQLNEGLGTAEKAEAQTINLRREDNPRRFWRDQFDQPGHSDDISGVLRLLPSGWITFELINCKKELSRMRDSCLDAKGQRIFPGVVGEESRRLEALDEETKTLRSGDFTRFGNDYMGLATLCLDQAAFRPLRKHRAIVRNNRDIGAIGSWLGDFRATAYAQTGVNLGIVACALERHRIAHGVYPESLEALDPRFGNSPNSAIGNRQSAIPLKLPHDIITGNPLLYNRREPQSYLLYSVGWNERDDGGQVALARNAFYQVARSPSIKAEWNDRANGDWVWSVPAPGFPLLVK